MQRIGVCSMQVNTIINTCKKNGRCLEHQNLDSLHCLSVRTLRIMSIYPNVKGIGFRLLWQQTRNTGTTLTKSQTHIMAL